MQRSTRRSGTAVLLVVLGTSALGVLWFSPSSTPGRSTSRLLQHGPEVPQKAPRRSQYVPHAIPPFLTLPSDARLWR